ncbi:GNAT family N-acetyltransferase [Fusibacter bizertensis]
MDIKFREISLDDVALFQYMEKWTNDPEIRPFATPRFSEKEYTYIFALEIMASLSVNSDKHVYIVLDGEKPIGELSIDMKFAHRIYDGENTAWISLLIGDSEYRGKGISKMMMAFIENECRKLGADAIELGVFEYNVKAQNLYLNSGYERIGEIKNFVYNFGKWHSDIRMLKKLS